MKLYKKSYKTKDGKTYYDFAIAFPYKVGNIEKEFILPLSTNYKSEQLRKVAYKTLLRNAVEKDF